MNHVLIIGAKSDMATQIANLYAGENYRLTLAARRVNELENFKKDLEVRYNAEVDLLELDLTLFNTHKAIYNGLAQKPNLVIMVAGYMVDQKLTETDWAESLNTINVNYAGAVSFLNVVANDFELRKEGTIIGISSVAGERGRKSNYLYGSAKAGFTAYLSGLRNRLVEANVHVVTVKPGFVNTKMTEGLDLPQKLTAEPLEVAKKILKAHKKKKNVVYVKPIWALIMLIIRSIPEFIFKKLSI